MQQERPHASLRNIIKATCQVMEISRQELTAPSRCVDPMMARKMAYYIGRVFGHSSTRIGEALKRDHSCVIVGAADFKLRLDEDTGDLRRVVEAIISRAIALTEGDAPSLKIKAQPLVPKRKTSAHTPFTRDWYEANDARWRAGVAAAAARGGW